MKDRQIEPSSGEARIPILSSVLHLLAMPGFVLLRYRFGLTFLRPRSVFFAASWAFGLFIVYAWLEPGAWQEWRPVCIFGGSAVFAYWVHSLIAFSQQLSGNAPHDHYSGRSHLFRLWDMVRAEPVPGSMVVLGQLWIEPALLLVASGILTLRAETRPLGKWLAVIAACYWCKEAINFWYGLRFGKRHQDVFEDASDTASYGVHSEATAEPPKATRQPRVRRQRKGDAEPESRE